MRGDRAFCFLGAWLATPLTQPARIVGAQVVVVPPELVAIVGAERMRKLLAAYLRSLKSLQATGGKVVAELDAKPGPVVVDGHCGPRERL